MSAARRYNLGPTDRIPLGEGRVFILEGARVAVFRTRNDQLYATQADCPHRGGPLADGIVSADRVVCPLHAFAFDLATGEAHRKDCQGLKVYRVARSERGDVVVELESPWERFEDAGSPCSKGA